jgi:hypothetical protein
VQFHSKRAELGAMQLSGMEINGKRISVREAQDAR